MLYAVRRGVTPNKPPANLVGIAACWTGLPRISKVVGASVTGQNETQSPVLTLTSSDQPGKRREDADLIAALIDDSRNVHGGFQTVLKYSRQSGRTM